MSTATIAHPEVGEHIPYYERYISLIRAADVLPVLEAQGHSTAQLLASVPESRAGHRYEPGKWSIRQVVGHLADGERVFSYRALRFSRGDATPLPGFDENTYAEAGGFDARTLGSVREELMAVRQATLALFRSLPPEALLRRGKANDAEVTVRALAWIIAGHEAHHVRLLRERYGVSG